MWNDADDSRGIGLLFADGGRNATAVRRVGAAANCATLKNRNIHTRQPHPWQKRFRIKGGCGDEALRIGDFLILKNAKHPI